MLHSWSLNNLCRGESVPPRDELTRDRIQAGTGGLEARVCLVPAGGPTQALVVIVI